MILLWGLPAKLCGIKGSAGRRSSQKPCNTSKSSTKLFGGKKRAGAAAATVCRRLRRCWLYRDHLQEEVEVSEHLFSINCSRICVGTCWSYSILISLIVNFLKLDNARLKANFKNHISWKSRVQGKETETSSQAWSILWQCWLDVWHCNVVAVHSNGNARTQFLTNHQENKLHWHRPQTVTIHVSTMVFIVHDRRRFES